MGVQPSSHWYKAFEIYVLRDPHKFLADNSPHQGREPRDLYGGTQDGHNQINDMVIEP